MDYLVRIKPSIPCDSYNEFYKAKGWHKVTEEMARWCATRRLHDLSPDAPLVFDVMTAAEAELTAAAEQLRVDPSGTPETPVDLRSRADGAASVLASQREEHATLLAKMEADREEAARASRALEEMRAEAARISELAKKAAADRAAAEAELAAARAEAEAAGVAIDGDDAAPAGEGQEPGKKRGRR